MADESAQRAAGFPEIETAARELAAAARTVAAAADALRKIAKAGSEGRNIALHAGEELEQLKKLAPAVKKTDPSAVLGRVEPLLVALEDEAGQAAEREAVRQLGDLEVKLKEKGRTLSGRYPELVCGVLTLVVEKTGKEVGVSIYYGPRLARLDAVAGLDPEKVAAAVDAAYHDLDTALIPEPDLLRVLQEAWRMARLRRGDSGDEGSAPIVDVLAELCFLRQSPQFYRNPVRAAFTSYGQVSFSYQLFLLRERTIDAAELTLGIATRDEVKLKHSLWVPRNLNGDGVHYSSLGFRRTA